MTEKAITRSDGAVHYQAEPSSALVPTDSSLQPATLGQLQEFAKTFAVSQLLPKHLRDKPADVAITVLYGRELGLTPMQAIQGIHVIEGKPSLSAAMAVALVKRSPLCEFFELVESSAKIATYETQRKGARSPSRMSFTIEEAQAAGLYPGKDNWKKYPAAMLRSRAALSLARDVYPDVVANIISEDEADDLRGTPPSAFVAPPPAAVAPAPFKAPANTIEATSGPVPARAEPAPAADAPLLARIQAAATMDALVALIPDCKKVTGEAEKNELLAAYAKRKAELVPPLPPVAAPIEQPAPVEREVGADDE